MGKESKGRKPYLDAMKGVSILMVVFAHSLMNADKNLDSEYARIINCIAFVAVPNFFFINGYLYNHKLSLTPIKSIIKKFKGYYIPFVGFSLVYWAFHNVFVSLHLTTEARYSVMEYIKHFFLIFALHMESDLNGPMWFLRALIVMVSMYIVIDYLALKIKDKRIRYVVLTILMLFMYFLGRTDIVPMAFNLRKAVLCIIFFYLGVFVRELDLDRYIDKYTVVVWALGMIMLIITTYTSLGGVGGSIEIIDLPGALCGILGIYAFCKLPKISESKFLAFFGNASLDIMCVHFLAFKPISYLFVMTKGLPVERLSELPVLRGTHGFECLLYTVVALSLCSVEYLLRTKICKRFL